MRTLPAALFILSWGAVRPATAQWYVGVEIAATRYGGSSRDTSSGHVATQGRPGDASAISLRIARSWRRFGIALRGSYAKPGLAVTGQHVTLTDKRSGDVFEAATALSTQVGGIGPSGAIRVELGPTLHLWDFDGEIRARFGAIGAAAYEWPITKRLTGSVRLEGMLSPSWFDAADVPPEFERRVTWRYGVGLGLYCRL
jgi:hypothetical protein